MKDLTAQQANAYLQSVGMKLDDWNRITDMSEGQHRKPKWINYRPNNERLLIFSQHVAGWLPKGNWKIFQIDNSTGWMDPVQLSLFGGLLWGANDMPSAVALEKKTFFFEFGKDEIVDENTELLISNLVFIFLSFESHGYVVSSNSSKGQILGVQDGYIYFSSRDTLDISNAKYVLENFEKAPSTPPEWVSNIFVKRQEASLRVTPDVNSGPVGDVTD